MGQHKYNPIAIAAKNGELTPKKRTGYSKRGFERALMNGITRGMFSRLGLHNYTEPYDYYQMMNSANSSKFHK